MFKGSIRLMLRSAKTDQVDLWGQVVVWDGTTATYPCNARWAYTPDSPVLLVGLSAGEEVQLGTPVHYNSMYADEYELWLTTPGLSDVKIPVSKLPR